LVPFDEKEARRATGGIGKLKRRFKMLKLINLIVGVALSAVAQNQEVAQISWTASLTPGIAAYNVYRATLPPDQISDSCDAANLTYLKVNSTPVAALTYTDKLAPPGSQCYYITALWSNNIESIPSNKILVGVIRPLPPTEVKGTLVLALKDANGVVIARVNIPVTIEK
jgi:hypothetical protein